MDLYNKYIYVHIYVCIFICMCMGMYIRISRHRRASNQSRCITLLSMSKLKRFVTDDINSKNNNNIRFPMPHHFSWSLCFVIFDSFIGINLNLPVEDIIQFFVCVKKSPVITNSKTDLDNNLPTIKETRPQSCESKIKMKRNLVYLQGDSNVLKCQFVQMSVCLEMPEPMLPHLFNFNNFTQTPERTPNYFFWNFLKFI